MEKQGKQISFDLNTNSFEHILQELGLSESEKVYAYLLKGKSLGAITETYTNRH